jgi:hypothetical protein
MRIKFQAILWIDEDDDCTLWTKEELQQVLQDGMDTVCISVNDVEILSQGE